MNFKIPKLFFSDSDKKPFRKCKVCEIELSDGKVPYSIEKAYKRTPEGEDITLFEIAICMPCAEKQSQKMSQESQQFLQKVMMNNDFMKRRMNLWKNWEEDWNKKCLFSEKTPNINDEYHVVGHFRGNKVIEQQSPFLIGPEMIEHIQENLSAETKEEMDDFGRTFLGPDPTIAKLLEEGKFVMV